MTKSFLMVSSLRFFTRKEYEIISLATSHCCFPNRLFLFLCSEGHKVKKKNDEEKSLGINAQFRAIQPSQSILSYVEENVIYVTRSLWYLS